MHSYQVDEVIRTRVVLIAVILSIASARLFDLVQTSLAFKIPWWIETPSVLGFFGLFIWLYDIWLWKVWPFKTLTWFYTPNLNGKWDVAIKSSYEGFEKTTKATATIRQTATRICIGLQASQSYSYSVYGILTRTERLNAFELIYHYFNYPNPDAVETMSIHRGTAWAQIADKVQTMEGEYYSGRGRQHFGKILFTRIKRDKNGEGLDNSR